MSQISIPCVAHLPLEWQPKNVDPQILATAPRIEPRQYLDDEHYLSIYCPDCGVRCTRRPRKAEKRIDNVLAFFSHIGGYDNVSCRYRKPGKNAGVHGEHKEGKAANLLSFSGWKDMDEYQDDCEEDERTLRFQRVVQGGRAGGSQGHKIVTNGDDGALHPGEFRTVRRLVKAALGTTDTYIKFPNQEPVRLGYLFVWIEKVLRDRASYIGKNFIAFGQPASIEVGNHFVFINFTKHWYHLAVQCSHNVFEKLNWKTTDISYCYVFYGLLEPGGGRSFVNIVHIGQICRFRLTKIKQLNSVQRKRQYQINPTYLVLRDKQLKKVENS